MSLVRTSCGAVAQGFGRRDEAVDRHDAGRHVRQDVRQIAVSGDNDLIGVDGARGGCDLAVGHPGCFGPLENARTRGFGGAGKAEDIAQGVQVACVPVQQPPDRPRFCRLARVASRSRNSVS